MAMIPKKINYFKAVCLSLIYSIIFIIIALPLHAQVTPYKWGNLKIGGGGYVTGIAIHPKDKNIMYIRTDVGGAYRWNKKTEQWEQMLNWVGPDNANLIGVDGMALDLNKPNRIYLALGKRITGEGGVYRSDDRGETWEKLMTASYEGNGRAARWIGECIAVDPNSSSEIYAGTRKKGLWHSKDDGKNWIKISDIPDGFTGTNPSGVRSIVFDPLEKTDGRSSTIYVGVPGNGIFCSVDGGVSFKQMIGSPKNPARMQVIKHELFVSHDTGISLWSDGKWIDISPVIGKNYVGLAVDVNDNRKIIIAQRYGAFFNPIFRTEDKGKTWEQINTKETPVKLNVNVPWWPQTRFSSATAGMSFIPDNSGGLYYTDWFGVWNTPNIWAKSTEWNNIVKGLEETVILTLVSPPSGALVYSGMADDFGFKHINTEDYPAKRLFPLNECFSISVCENKPSHLAILGAKSWAGDKTTLATSSDFGENWTELPLPDGAVLGKIAISSINPENLVYITGNGKAYYSHNHGDNWNVCQNIPENIIAAKDVWNRENVLASDNVDGSFYIFKDGILYSSIDGADWKAKNQTLIPSSTGTYKNVITVPGHSGELWICLDNYGLWKTTNAGISFNRVSIFKNAKLFSCGAPAPNSKIPTIYCYGTIEDKWGLYRSIDMGESWVLLNDDKHQFSTGSGSLSADRNIFGRVYIGSGGGGILYGEPIKDN